MSSDLVEMYRRMVLIREVDETLVRLFAEGRVPGSSIPTSARNVGGRRLKCAPVCWSSWANGWRSKRPCSRSDKIETKAGSPAAGVLLRRIGPEVEVPVREGIGVIGEPGEDVSGVALFDAEAGP